MRRQNAAACVSLSNSTMSKTVAAWAAPPEFAGGARSGVSIEPPYPCQPSFSGPFPRRLEDQVIGTERIVRGPEGIPSRTGSDSVEGAEDIVSFRKVKCETSPFRLSPSGRSRRFRGRAPPRDGSPPGQPRLVGPPQLRPVDRKKPKKVARPPLKGTSAHPPRLDRKPRERRIRALKPRGASPPPLRFRPGPSSPCEALCSHRRFSRQPLRFDFFDPAGEPLKSKTVLGSCP